MQDKTALIIVNGELPNKNLLKQLMAKSQVSICTDGAANPLKELDLIPNIIIGDLDSLTEEVHEFFAEHSKIIDRPSQYATDFEKAFDYAEEQGFEKVFLTGLKGGRFDHAFSNLSVLKKYTHKFEIHIFDEDGRGILLDARRQKEVSLNVAKNTTISLLPLPEAQGITTSGLLYPLNNEALIFGEREGQSNMSSQEEVRVKIESGVLLIFYL